MQEFIDLCHFYGSLDELTQAGGGNISVKDYSNNTLIIKSSGFCLADITSTTGYSVLDFNIDIENLFSQNNCNIQEFKVLDGGRPSIETFFHIFLKRYTVHLHPTLLNCVLCSANSSLPKINNYKYLDIEYQDPGFVLSKNIFKKYNNHDIIFLRNHGVIFTADNLNNLKTMIEDVYKIFDNCSKFTDLAEYTKVYNTFSNSNSGYNKIFLKIDLHSSFIQKISDNFIVFYAYTPDIVVYLTNTVVTLDNGKNCYIVSTSKYKCYQIYEVLKSYIWLHQYIEEKTFINNTDSTHLLHREDEKFRKKL